MPAFAAATEPFEALSLPEGRPTFPLRDARPALAVGNAGFITMVVGAGIATLSVPVLISADGDWRGVLLGVGILAVGGTGVHVGQVIMNASDLDAAYRLRGSTGEAPIVLGWVSAGLVVTGTSVFVATSVSGESAGQAVGGGMVGAAVIPSTIAHFQLRTGDSVGALALAPAMVPVPAATGEIRAAPGFSFAATW